MEKYSHLIEIDEEKRRLVISRVFDSGERHLYTYVDLPAKTRAEDVVAYDRFVSLLGENLVIDSSAARNLLDL